MTWNEANTDTADPINRASAALLKASQIGSLDLNVVDGSTVLECLHDALDNIQQACNAYYEDR